VTEIWDVHCHLSGVKGASPEERADQLIAFADRMAISRMCIFMGLAWSYEPSPEKLRQDNDEILRAVAHRPDRLLGFVYLNPQHVRASLDELNRCVRDGPMVGVKLWVAKHCQAAELDPIIERATELKAPVLQHTWIKVAGNLPGESTPQELAELAGRHPEATLICGHSGGDWEQGIRAVRQTENVFVELGGGDPTAGFTEMAVSELGAKRVLFGSDAGGRSFASQLAKVYGADIDESAKRHILSDNLRRILKPILVAKGIEL
jgi:predicted TIM-barrel fold metal-dependent hydrolase